MERLEKFSFSLPASLMAALDAHRQKLAETTGMRVSMNGALQSVLTRALAQQNDLSHPAAG